MKNELAIFNPENTMERECFTSVNLNSEESRIDLFNATENADVLLNDIVGQVITIKDIYIEKNPIKEVDDETGEVTFNGVKTTVLAPTGDNNQILDRSYFTYQGPTWDIFDGEYVIGKMRFTKSQQQRGVIASFGGNRNSIETSGPCRTSPDIPPKTQ